MNYANDPERERILTQALGARTATEVEVAIQELRRWVKDHPDDLGIIDAFEPLALRQLTYGKTNPVDVTEHASTT